MLFHLICIQSRSQHSALVQFMHLIGCFIIAAYKVHVSLNCKEILDRLGGYQMEPRGMTSMKVSAINDRLDIKYICFYGIGYFDKINVIDSGEFRAGITRIEKT